MLNMTVRNTPSGSKRHCSLVFGILLCIACCESLQTASLVQEQERGRTRRDVIDVAFRSSLFLPLTQVLPETAEAGILASDSSTTAKGVQARMPGFGISDKVLSSLVFGQILGKGTYKTVYLVSTKPHVTNGQQMKYALAVERLRGKSDSKDAFRGVNIAEKLQALMQGDDKFLFEKVEDWWLQSTPLPEFVEGTPVFPNLDTLGERTRKTPGKFLGSKWLISIKPLYDMDLKAFTQRSPMLYPIGNVSDQNDESHMNAPVAGLKLNEAVSLKLAFEMCHAGKLMHQCGLVHRDIKPKNIMLSKGRPVIIDFGYSQFLSPYGTEKRMCIVQQGQVKGEVRYVLAEDVAKYMGCQEGDTYALGKTMYELFFDTAPKSEPSGRQKITSDEAESQNLMFRSVLFGDEAGLVSRFHMSQAARDIILSTIRGMCRKNSPMTLAEAEIELVRGMECLRIGLC